MGLKELFRKEDKLLGAPKPIPDLASENLNDESAIYEARMQEQSVKQEIPSIPELMPAEPVRKQAIPEIEIPRPELATMRPAPQQETQVNQSTQPIHSNNLQPALQPQLIHYPVPQMNYIPNYAPHNYAFNYSSHLPPSFDIPNSERAPLKRLLAEIDHLELKWHGLSNQKQSMEKELKYLEAEIEHKLKLLRSHMAIANETSEVDDGHQFYLADGQILYSRNDLATAAKGMSQRVFDHHVGPGWNDFSKWADHSLKDKVLAKRLQGVKNPQELVSALQKY